MARAPALHAGGQGFDSLILHENLFFIKYWKLEFGLDNLFFNLITKGSIPLLSTIRQMVDKFFDMLEENLGKRQTLCVRAYNRKK